MWVLDHFQISSARGHRLEELPYRMINVEESSARGQLVGLFDLFNSSDRQEHADGRAQGEETHRLKG